MPDDDTTTGKAGEADKEADEVARLFREHDNIGPDSSLLLRVIGQLIRQGKPLGQVVMLAFKPPEGDPLQFGMVTATENNRLVFWPALPSGADMPCGEIKAVDHITLEFPSEKMHATGYDANGDPVHDTQAWKLQHHPGSDVVLWFTLLVKTRVLQEQPTAVQRKVATPATDKQRRVDVLTRFAERLKFTHVAVPDTSDAGDYIAAAVYLATGPVSKINFSDFVFPANLMATEVSGWPDGEFQIGRAKMPIGTRTLAVAAARPPGTLKAEVAIGLPRRAK